MTRTQKIACALAALTLIAVAIVGTVVARPVITHPGATGHGIDLPLPADASAKQDTPKPAAPSLNDRGLIPKKLGQDGGLTGTDGKQLVAGFAIDKVQVDPPCSEYGTPPAAGHTLLLSVSVATGNDQAAAEELSFLLNGGNFVEIGADGVTRPSQFGSCTDAMVTLPGMFGVNQKYSGQIEVVVPEASGTLALTYPGADSGGWEWQY